MILNHGATNNINAINRLTASSVPQAWLSSKTIYQSMAPSKNKLDAIFSFKEQQPRACHDLNQ